MRILERLYGWYGKLTVRAVGAILLLLILTVFIRGGEETPSTTEEPLLPQVVVATPASLLSDGVTSLIGTVAPKTQAKLVAETSGRVVAVNASLGETVAAGTIIAQLENASERAAVLQAQGVYEAAEAAARQSVLSVSSAASALRGEENTAVTTHATAYTTVSNIVRSTLDPFYGNPDGRIIGLKVDGRGYQSSLLEARRALQTSLPAWQVRATTLTPNGDITQALRDATVTTNEVLALVDMFIAAFSDTNSSLTEETARAYVSDLSTQRSALLAVTASLQAAETKLLAASDALARAEAAGSQTTPLASAAQAQVKQALGSLRAAEANLAKTIIRTPISGTVNILPVRVGDYVGQNSLVAEVANISGFEITTYVTEAEVNSFAIGDEVIVKGEVTGTVTNISPVVDNSTGKIEVRIGVDTTDLRDGETVNLTLKNQSSNVVSSNRILVPLTAVKLGTDTASVFVVNSENILEARTVTLGPVIQDTINIIDGLTADTEIVLDVRGRSAGEVVTVVVR